MVDAIDITEPSEIHGHLPAPVLVVLADGDARVDAQRPVLGRDALSRLIVAAGAAGFERAILTPGTAMGIEAAQAFSEASREAGERALPVSDTATGESLGRPALVVFEGTVLNPDVLELMVEHPLEPGERYTLYDEVGRPAACFFGELQRVPAMLPLTEELPWPEPFGPADVVRQVDPEDLRRAQELTLRSAGLPAPEHRGWSRDVERPVLRWMADSGRPLAQLNLLGVGLVVSALPMALVGGFFGTLAAGLGLVVGVMVTSLVGHIRHLRAAGGGLTESVDEHLAAAARPLGHAAIMAGLTYVIVAETDRSSVAAVVLLVAGVAAVLLSLLQARLLLRGRDAEIFRLPNAEGAARRLGVPWWPGLDHAPIFELLVLLASAFATPELPWSVLATGALARLWRWYAGPPVSLRDAVGEPQPEEST
ncbi:MAG: hypothetical protein ACE37F_10435 [Nannocystaceae bacterium]|nr:hypothetical protein [bacterium]